MIDTDKYEELIESIVVCEEEWIKGWDSLLEDCTFLKDGALELLSEVVRLREGIEHALHIRLRHGQEEGWKELKELIE